HPPPPPPCLYSLPPFLHFSLTPSALSISLSLSLSPPSLAFPSVFLFHLSLSLSCYPTNTLCFWFLLLFFKFFFGILHHYAVLNYLKMSPLFLSLSPSLSLLPFL